MQSCRKTTSYFLFISLIALIIGLSNPAWGAASASFVAGTSAGWDYHTLATDIAKNNTVDMGDLSIIAQQWLANGCGSSNQWCAGADLDDSTSVDLVDYAILAKDWSKTGASDILLQTIYGSAQNSAGLITANTAHALSVGKECLMVFNVPQAVALDKGWFKVIGFKAGYTFRVRLLNVTGQGLLNTGHTITKASIDAGSPLIDLSLPTGGSVPSHTENAVACTDLIINFGPLEVTAGDYMIVFNNAGGGNTIGSMVRGVGTAGDPNKMGRYPDNTPLPKRATVTTSSTSVGNTYFYYLSSSSSTSYQPVSNLLAFQISTTIVNHPPVVNAGTNQTIQSPAAANLSGTATDDGYPNPLVTTWSKVNGPGTIVFGDASALSTTATFSDIGTYVLMLSAFDGELTSTSLVTVNYTNNSAPVVNAGADVTVGILDATNLAGTVTDDGLPNPPATVTTAWTQQSGPGIVTFGNASAVNTSVSFSATGTYVLRLAADDSELSSYDEVTYTVVDGSLNAIPVVNAGPDVTVSLPATIATLSGTATDDGKPVPPGTLTITWTQQSGPGTITFGNIHSANTTARASAFGTYVLRLTASDSVLQSFDETTVTFKDITYEGYDCNSCTYLGLDTCNQQGLTQGGNNGAVIHVTTLADTGSGSLHSAIAAANGAAYPGTKIVFDVGGTIHNSTTFQVLGPYITIAGETAPSPGITIDGSNCNDSLGTVNVNGHDIIIRNLRVRHNGVNNREIVQCPGDWNLIFDHLSLSDGMDGGLDINNGTHNIIVSWCIIANTMEAHRSYGDYASLHHNFYYGNNRRQPKIVNPVGPYDWRNNVMENWTGTGTNVEAGHQVNIINNYYGPNTSNKGAGAYFHIEPTASVNVYIAGNTVPSGDPDINLLGDRSTPNYEPNVTTYPADTALQALVKGHAGCMPRDAYDTAIAGPAAP